MFVPQIDENRMRKLLFLTIALLTFSFGNPNMSRLTDTPKLPELPLSCRLFAEMGLEGIINFNAFEQAITGYMRIEDKRKEIITLIDYSKPSTEERLYVLDMNRKKLVYKTLVSHGRNSGSLYATSFSNKYGSYQSSLGFFLTENTYSGKNGYSLVLEGLEQGINDMAKGRAIVMHGAPYSNPSVINSTGRLGRSLGCPALPENLSKEIINLIKNGSLIYIYADNQEYLAQSPILNDNTESVGKDII